MTDYINTKIKGLKYGYLMNDSSSDKIISTLYSYLVEADDYISRKIKPNKNFIFSFCSFRYFFWKNIQYSLSSRQNKESDAEQSIKWELSMLIFKPIRLR